MVEMIDGSVIAEMAEPDMAIPVAYALAFPDRLPLDYLKPLSLVERGNLTFEEPDPARFPCLQLAYQALEAGGTMAACLNAANEELVAAFLCGRASFADIPHHIETVMMRHNNCPARTLEDLYEVDGWARAQAQELIGQAPAASL
jgi:1-deoxy-D-xylulose-5-phosphate reductoisomerase